MTLTAWVHCSHAMGNAPPGYVVARVGLGITTLFVEAEFNLHTGFAWRGHRLGCGFRNDPCAQVEWLGTIAPEGELKRVFDAIRELYDATYACVDPLTGRRLNT